MGNVSLYIILFYVVNLYSNQPADSTGELALVEIVSSGADGYEPNDNNYHVGFLYAKTIETKGKYLPKEFKLAFRYARSSKAEVTPWNNIPKYRSSSDLRIFGGEWIISKFIKKGDSWEIISSEKLFDLCRPEDMPPERLKQVQAYFSTPLIRVWIPENDVLKDTLDKTKWRMTVEQFKEAFKNYSLVEEKWNLSRQSGSFRKTIVVTRPNTELLFTFSGVVDINSPEHLPLSSCLISYEIKHPLKSNPDPRGLTGPSQSMHYKYLKKLHDDCISRFKNEGIKYNHEDGVFDDYKTYERIISETVGTIQFLYWSNISQVGITAKAPQKLIEEDLKKERVSALQATKDWPIPIDYDDYIRLRRNLP